MKTTERSDATAGVLQLSAHEMSALILLSQAPIEIMFSNPDLFALQQAGLAELTKLENGISRFAITREGRAVLRALGIRGDTEEQDPGAGPRLAE